MPKPLIIANGRGDYGYNDLDGHLYVCATSKAHAVRLLKEAGYSTITIGEFNTYWNKGTWGCAMDGITPEIGVWFVPKEYEHEHETGYKPARLDTRSREAAEEIREIEFTDGTKWVKK